MEFKDFILFEATKTAMLDVSIPNIDKVLKDESQIIFFLDKQIKVYEKFDGTKLTLLRNEQPFLNDYRNNWIVSYKGNVLYPQSFKHVNRKDIKKESIGISQYALIFDHLHQIHQNTKDIPPNTEFFVEFIMNKPTITRDYKHKHQFFLIGYAPVLDYKINNGKIEINSDKLVMDKREEYAEILNINVPPLLLDGNLNNFKNSVRSKKLHSIYRRHKKLLKTQDVKQKLNIFKTIFTEVPSILGGKVEGVVIEYDDMMLKILQQDQHDPIVRAEKKQRYRMEDRRETSYYEAIKDAALQKIDLLGKISSVSQAMQYLGDLIYNDKHINIQHDKKGLLNIKDDIFLTAKQMVVKYLPGNNWALIQGRFQPLTKAHVEMINYGLGKYDGVIVVIITGDETDKSKNPFDFETRKLMVETVFRHRKYEVVESKSGFIPTVINKIDKNINAVIAGSDRVLDYRKQLEKMSDVVVDEIERTEDDISASKVRQALVNNNLEQFKQNMPFELYYFFDVLKEKIKIGA